MQASFDARLTVFSGPNCPNLQCVEQILPTSTEVDQLVFQWVPEEGERQYVVVDAPDGVQGGEFNLTVIEIPSTASPLDSEADNPTPNDTFIGTDEPGESSTEVPTMGVESGEVPSEIDTLVFDSDEGALYYLFVESRSSTTGAYEITVEDAPEADPSAQALTYQPTPGLTISETEFPSYGPEETDSPTTIVRALRSSSKSENGPSTIITAPSGASTIFATIGGTDDQDHIDEKNEGNTQTNDFCSQALYFPIGSRRKGTIKSSTYDDEVALCEIESAGSGVWYLLFVSGGTVDVSFKSDFTPRVSLFSGQDCSSLVCVDSVRGSYADGTSGFLTFEVIESERYYLHVAGAIDLAIGDFDLSVQQARQPRNNICSSAYPLSTGVEVEGQMRYATNDSLPACGDPAASGLWYILQGSDQVIQAILDAEFDGQLIVFTGLSCDSIVTCVGASDTGRKGSFRWWAEQGVQYFIYLAKPDSNTNMTSGVFSFLAEVLPDEEPRRAAMELKQAGDDGSFESLTDEPTMEQTAVPSSAADDELLESLTAEPTTEQTAVPPSDGDGDSMESFTEAPTLMTEPTAVPSSAIGNDNCRAATRIEFSKTLFGSTKTASFENGKAPSCGDSLERSAWYRFRAREASVQVALEADFEAR